MTSAALFEAGETSTRPEMSSWATFAAGAVCGLVAPYMYFFIFAVIDSWSTHREQVRRWQAQGCKELHDITEHELFDLESGAGPAEMKARVARAKERLQELGRPKP